MVLTGQGMAQAFGPSQPTPVSAVPSKATPNVLDGTVFAITQVGSTMVIGGSFTKAANPGGTTQVTDATNGKYILAFDATTGAVKTAFAPGLDGIVQTLQPGPTANTVYVGGLFNNVGGLKAKGLVLLDLTTAKRVTTFAAPAINGGVQSVRRVGNRLFVGGTFTSWAGQPRGGLASLNATTGVLDSFVHSTVATNHNWTAANGGAKAAVGVFGMDVTPDGSRMVVIGNFKTVDGLPRDQIAMFDLTGASAVVRADWATHGYEAACYSWAYDTYVRDVEFSPNGSYFVVAATGGGNNTLCDSAARFETAGSGDDVKPSWVNWAGGDSYFSVAITDSAVYIGGHQRWMNNPIGNDYPGGAAVPRPGLGALDPSNGIPLTWNPGRNPRGAGAYVLFASPSGLYVGSDTDYIGNRQYKRGKIAFFPLAGGTPVASNTTPSLPGSVYLGGAPAPRVDPASVLYRVNAGGPALTATDGGPDWVADDGSSPYRTGNSTNAAGWGPIQSVDSTVPENTPSEIFSSERWDSGSKGDGDEMHWAFPVPAGTQVSVRLYFANQCSCTDATGARQFDVAVDGTQVLDHFDIVAAAGHYTGTMRSFPVTSDGTVNIDFTHEVENPLVNGIEIVKASTATTTTTTSGLSSRSFDGTTAGPLTPVPTDLDWSAVRGAVLIGGQLYYGLSDSTFHRRTFDGTTFGPAQLVDPYNDPTWSNVDTGSGQTFRGTVPDFYGQLSHLSSLVYSDGRLYYTLNGSSALYYRAFSPDSGIIGAQPSTVPGVSNPGITGAFVSGGYYWFVDGATGNLDKVTFTPGTVSGPASFGSSVTVVSGPSTDGVDWRSRSLFLGPAGKSNTPPVAQASSSCGGLTCTFDGSHSTDPDGSVSSYAWAFGDGTTGTGATVAHTYTAAGNYTATLTVTDNQGATSTTTTAVTVTAANQPPTASATASCSALACSFDASGSTDPDGSISSYAWSFGDGQSGTGKTVQHSYGSAGDYHATLTVTDNQGATAQQQITVSPANPGTPGVGFRGVSGTDVLAAAATVKVPASVQAGDLMILNVGAAGAATQTPPAGWTQVAQQAPTGVLTTVWQRMATSTDAGSSVTVTFGSSQKADLTLIAYFGAGAIDPAVARTATDATSAGSHKAPDVTATKPGSYALWFWNVKSSGTTALTVPSGTVSRNAASGSGTGYITTLAAESSSSVTGTVTGPTSVANGSSTTGRTIMISLVIPPA